MQHVHSLMENLDGSYTDVQIEEVLVDECWLEEEFPNGHEDSFEKTAFCKKFGKGLADARHLWLGTGDTEGYEGFCAEYYVHKGGVIPGKEKKTEAPPRKIKKPPKMGLPMIMITMS